MENNEYCFKLMWLEISFRCGSIFQQDTFQIKISTYIIILLKRSCCRFFILSRETKFSPPPPYNASWILNKKWYFRLRSLYGYRFTRVYAIYMFICVSICLPPLKWQTYERNGTKRKERNRPDHLEKRRWRKK